MSPVYVLTFHDRGDLLAVAGLFADYAGAEVAALVYGARYFRPRGGEGTRWEAICHNPPRADLGDPFCRIELRDVAPPVGLAEVLTSERYGSVR